jgi:putative flippase GtrA
MLVLASLVEVVGLPPATANAPSLLAGAAVQFFGCRHLVFSASSGAVGRQLVGFASTEIATLALNGLLFHILLTFTPIPYGLARLVGTFLVFIVFSYPVWHLVFRTRETPTT